MSKKIYIVRNKNRSRAFSVSITYPCACSMHIAGLIPGHVSSLLGAGAEGHRLKDSGLAGVIGQRVAASHIGQVCPRSKAAVVKSNRNSAWMVTVKGKESGRAGYTELLLPSGPLFFEDSKNE